MNKEYICKYCGAKSYKSDFSVLVFDDQKGYYDPVFTVCPMCEQTAIKACEEEEEFEQYREKQERIMYDEMWEEEFGGR